MITAGNDTKTSKTQQGFQFFFLQRAITWISFSLHDGWLISPASSTWLAIACSNSGYPALSNTIPGKRSLIRLKNNGSSSSIYDKRPCLDIKKELYTRRTCMRSIFFLVGNEIGGTFLPISVGESLNHQRFYLKYKDIDLTRRVNVV